MRKLIFIPILIITVFIIFKNMATPIKKHFSAQSAIESYRIQSDTGITEVQFKNNRFYLKTDQFIIVDNTAYYKDGSGQWQLSVLPLDQVSAYNRFRPEAVRQNYQKYQLTSTFTPQGREKCGQLNCYKYGQTDASSSAIRTFWFDTKDYLLRRDIFKLGEFTSENSYSYDNINIDIPL